MLSLKKNQSIAILLLLVCFFASTTLALMHSTAHHAVSGAATNVKSDNSKNFLDNFIFAHQKFDHAKEKNCVICSVFNAQALLLSAELFSVMAFCLVFLTRFFDKTKLAYLSSSYSSRAPPYNL